MVCIPAKEVNGVLLDMHEGELAGHPGGRKLWQMALYQGYYWPTMQMLKTLQRSIKNAKGREMRYTPAIKVFIQL